jgi:hypothetical protein
MFKDIDDVVVMNQHRVSQSDYMGTSYGKYTRFGTGSTRSKGKTVGDVVFMRQGKSVIRFNQIADPHGVVRLAKSVRKSVIQALKTGEQKNKLLHRNRDQDVEEIFPQGGRKRGSVVICSQCKNENQEGSKFCNNCGAKLQNACPDCGKINPEKSVFCSQCGSNLSLDVAEESRKTVVSSEPGIAEDNFLEYVLLEYDIKIKYPTTWHRTEHDLKPPLVLAFSSSRETRSDRFLESIGISVLHVNDELAKNLTPQRCADSTIQNFKEKNSDFVLLESKPTALGGLPAQQVVFAAGGRKYLYVFTPKANKVYFMLYVSLPEKYVKFLPIVEQMITSFEFIS